MTIPRWKTFKGYMLSFLGILLGTLVATPLLSFIELTNISLLYVLAVVLAGVRYGRGCAVFAAVASALAFAYVFVPPHFSLIITEAQYVLTATIMLLVALLVGHLTATLKRHAEFVEGKSRESSALYDFAQHLTGALTPAAIVTITQDFLTSVLQLRHCRILLPADFAVPPPPLDAQQIATCVAHGRLSLFPQSDGATYGLMPLQAVRGLHGLLGFEIDTVLADSPSYHEFIETLGSVVAVALERAHYAELARETEIRHAAESLRSSILSALSHDLRTPLTALVGMADSLLLGKASPERTRYMLEAIHTQALSINQQMTNLLDMARLRSGHVELDAAWQPIEEVVGATLQLIKAQWKEREITLDLPPNLPPLYLDAVLMERVLWNLIENAIKYSPPDTPIELIAHQVDEAVELDVCDAGPGLPPGTSEELFGLFRRGERESTIPGVGLGLAIARSILDAHGGTISASNRFGGGACFRIRLPVGIPPCLTELEDLA